MVSSPVSYFGGKQFLAERLTAAFPPHKHFIECCGGSLAVLLAKPKSHMETVNDLDSVLQTFWRVLRDRPGDLERVCVLTPHSRSERELAYSITDDLPELEVARRVWIALTQGRTGSITRTGWRHNVRPTSTPFPVVLQRYSQRLAPAAARLQGVSLECRPAVEVVRSYGKERTSLLYVDPPYVVDPGVRRGGEYRVEMTNRGEHQELLEACLAANAAVIVSGYASELYDAALAGWYRYEIAASTQQGSGHGRRVEVVWSNRKLAGLGDDVSDQNCDQRFETQTRCDGCSAIVRQPKTGRKRRWCSDACKQRARRLLLSVAVVDAEDEVAATG